MNGKLKQLTQKRSEWVESSRDNNFEEGIKSLLTDLYPDNAHFIYELLQNAEDTGATEVRFTLNETGIEFKHNGRRLFSRSSHSRLACRRQVSRPMFVHASTLQN